VIYDAITNNVSGTEGIGKRESEYLPPLTETQEKGNMMKRN
jgi:hypothetical protein